MILYLKEMNEVQTRGTPGSFPLSQIVSVLAHCVGFCFFVCVILQLKNVLGLCVLDLRLFERQREGRLTEVLEVLKFPFEDLRSVKGHNCSGRKEFNADTVVLL